MYTKDQGEKLGTVEGQPGNRGQNGPWKAGLKAERLVRGLGEQIRKEKK